MKKFIAAILTIAIVVTSLYPVQIAQAAMGTAINTTSTGQGLSFYTDQYGPYVAQQNFSTTPQTFEMYVKCNNDQYANGNYIWYRNGVVLSNTDLETPGTFEFGFATGNRPFVAFHGDDGVREEFIFATKSTDNHNSVFLTGNWMHIAIVNDIANNQMICYVDGSEWATLSGAYTGTCTPSMPVCIGGDYREGNTMQFRGSIKGAAVFSGARTASQISSDYTKMKNSNLTSSESGLIAAYNLGLSSSNAEYPATVSDVTGTYNLSRTKYDYLTEAQAKSLSGRGDYDFSIAVVGDPQVLAAYEAKGSFTGSMDKMYKWIKDNASSRNIQYVLNMGDLTGSYEAAYEDAEWEIGASALKQLDGYVPYSIVRGNHDATDKYLSHFSWSEYGDTVDGSYENNMLTTYQKFEVSGIKYMLINLDFGVAEDKTKADSILRWANDLIASNPEYNVIINTHAYMSDKGELLYSGLGGAATNYGMAKDGQHIWDDLASQHENVVMVLNGHNGLGDVIKREDKGINGNNVVQMLVNPQVLDSHFANPGFTPLGAVTMLYFSNGGKTVHVENYSTLRDSYFGSTNQFSFDLNQVGNDVVTAETGAVALEYGQVDASESVPTPISLEYADYTFAGWFTGAKCLKEQAITDASQVTSSSYAKFVPSKMLDVKTQISTTTMQSGARAGKWAMRFISSVDDTTYPEVGFKVTYTDKEGQSKTLTSNTSWVYEKIASTETETSTTFSPRVISSASEYMFTVKLAVEDTDIEKARDYTVQAYYKTFDGTVVYGKKRVVCANDGLSGTSINVTVNADLNGSGYTATYTTNQDEYGSYASDPVDITVLSTGDGYSNIRVPAAMSSLNSVTKVVVYDGSGSAVATGTFRNYYTSHVPYVGATWNHKDFTWFSYPEETGKFLLGSTADLYAFSAMVNDPAWGNGTVGHDFEGQTVALARDLVINEGTAVAGTATTEPYWDANGNEIRAWDQIGGSWGNDAAFAGTFDGGGNAVSGIYISESADGVGFFRSLQPSAVVKDFAIVNSYIAGASCYMGTFVGYSYSQQLKDLYTDAILHNGRSGVIRLGGIAGHMDAASAGHNTIVEECWFDGQIYMSGTGTTYAGITGMLYDDYGANFTFTDCLFSGEMIQTYEQNWPNAGGIVGEIARSDGSSTHYSTLKIYNCVNTGTMSRTSTADLGGYPCGGIGAYLPWLSWTDDIWTTSEIRDCHVVTSDCYNYEIFDGGGIKYDVGYSEDVSLLQATTEAEVEALLPRLPEQLESPWKADVQNNGPIILKNFSHLYYK